ncbi:hypothetical protein [Nostoc sp.]|uniref:hypothetical protein n=1 Tax=Nostoc sp. TaxID=1180 RepID=UPI002FF6A23E
MTTSKKNSKYFQDIRRFHRILAPIMLLPLLLTAITGSFIRSLIWQAKEMRLTGY